MLLKLAERARRDEEYEAWPSIRRLMDDCGLSRRAVIYGLRALQEKGAIRESYRKIGRGGVVSYSLIREPEPDGKGADFAPIDAREKVQKTTQKVQALHEKGAKNDTKGAKNDTTRARSMPENK